VRLSPLGSVTTAGLLYQPQMMVIVDQFVEWRLAGETEVVGENLPYYHFVHHKSHMTWPGLEPGPPQWKRATNRLRYGTALDATIVLKCILEK
jgi:hypothetical protein